MCFPEIKKFSSNEPNQFYLCDGTKYAILKRCPPNEIYWPEEKACYQQKDEVSFDDTLEPGNSSLSDEDSATPKNHNKPHVIHQKLLSADVSLGEIYDAKKDQFIGGVSLWDEESITKHSKTTPLPHSEVHTKASNSVKDRLDVMDISAKLSLSFLGEL